MISSAWAHHIMGYALPATFAQGLLSGLGHPLIGADHAAFIVAAGFFLALVNRGMWGIAALVAGSLLGAAVHLQNLDLPGGEIGVALSVILIGALVIWRKPIGIAWMAAGLALAGILHGYAYAESIIGAEPAPLYAYLLGFSLVQFGLASAAYLVHRKAPLPSRLAPVLGTVVSAIGVTFLFS